MRGVQVEMSLKKIVSFMCSVYFIFLLACTTIALLYMCLLA